MGGSSCKIVNSTTHDIWVCADADRQYMSKITVEVEAEYAGFKAKGGVATEFEWTKIASGFARVPAREYMDFDIPQGGQQCFITAFSSTGKSFGGPKCFAATHGTYFNVVFCDDYAMRKGFKNKIFRVREGSKQYWGPFVCPGCKEQICKYPRVSGSSGACEKDPDPNM